MPHSELKQKAATKLRQQKLPYPDLLVETVLQYFSDGAFLILDQRGKIIWVNDPAPQVLQRSRESLLQQPFLEIIQLFQLDKKPLLADVHPVARVLTTGYKQ